MMKKPTTKKLPEKQVARTVTAKGKPFIKHVISGRKLSPDSTFSHVNSVVTCHSLLFASAKSINFTPLLEESIV